MGMTTQTSKGSLVHECDFDVMCGEAFATRDELHRHELDHWAAVEREQQDEDN